MKVRVTFSEVQYFENTVEVPDGLEPDEIRDYLEEHEELLYDNCDADDAYVQDIDFEELP